MDDPEGQAEELGLDPVGDGEPWSNEQDGKRIRLGLRKDHSDCRG